MYVCVSRSVMSDSVDSSLPGSLCPWDFPRQEYWSGYPFISPGDLSGLGIEPRFPTLQADSLPSEPSGKHPPPHTHTHMHSFLCGLSRNTDYRSLWCTGGSCCCSILTYNSLHLLIPNSQPIPPSASYPLGNQKFLLCVSVSVSQISSVVLYFRFRLQEV